MLCHLLVGGVSELSPELFEIVLRVHGISLLILNITVLMMTEDCVPFPLAEPVGLLQAGKMLIRVG